MKLQMEKCDVFIMQMLKHTKTYKKILKNLSKDSLNSDEAKVARERKVLKDLYKEKIIFSKSNFYRNSTCE